MSDAYDRERRLMPVLMRNERAGVPVDTEALEADAERYTAVLERIDRWVRTRLAATDLDVDSGEQLAAALIAGGAADPALFTMTPTGKLSTAKDSLMAAMTDQALLGVLRYRGYLATSLRTFIRPWAATAARTGGLIHTSWNQILGEDGGARTGRMSSTPNFQNAPAPGRAPIVFASGRVKTDAEGHPIVPCPIRGLPPLPVVRRYIVARRGRRLIDRDYSQQEPRFLAHFEDGAMLRMYDENPWIDFHDAARDRLREAYHRDYPRKIVKNINLGIIYGQGIGLLAERSNVTVEEARTVRNAILKLYPGLRDLNDSLRARAAQGEPLRTWGGRLYRCEEPRINKKTHKIQTFEYKMINTLIQGSAADCIKEAAIRYDDAMPADHNLLLLIHDEFLSDVPADEVDAGMAAMRVAMESIETDVPMLTEGTIGLNFAEMRDWDKRGVRV